LVSEARPGAEQPVQLPALLQILDPSERGDHLLADRRAFAPAFDDLQIGAAAGGLLAEIHGAGDSSRVRTGSPWMLRKSTKIYQRRGTILPRPSLLASNNNNGLSRASAPQL